MSKLLLALSITALALGIGCARLATDLQQERARSAALLERVHVLEATRSPQRSRLEPVAAPATTASLQIPQPRSLPGSSAAPAARGLAEVAQWRQALLVADPAYSRSLLAQQKRGLERLYGDLGPALGLPPDQVHAVVDLLAQQQLAVVDQRDPYAPTRLQQRLEKLIVSQLGERGPQLWREFESTLDVRQQLEAVRFQLGFMQVPLRDDQVEGIVKALAESDRRAGSAAVYPATAFDTDEAGSTAERLAALEQEMQRTEQITQRKREAIAGYLSLEQQAVLDSLQRVVRSSYRSALAQVQAAARAEAQGTRAISPNIDDMLLQAPLFAIGGSARLISGSLRVRYAPTEPCAASDLSSPAAAPES